MLIFFSLSVKNRPKSNSGIIFSNKSTYVLIVAGIFNMPRIYEPDPRGKRYKKYDENIIEEAIEYYRTSKLSLKVVAEKYNINKSVLYRYCTRTMKKQGGQTVLSEETKEHIIKYTNICAEWGYPLDSLDLRYLIKHYLDKLCRTVLKFSNNLLGPDFVRSFL